MYCHVVHIYIGYKLGICLIYIYVIVLTSSVSQVAEINNKIRSAPINSALYKLPQVENPSNEIAEVLVKWLKSLEWNMPSREWNLSVSDLCELNILSKGLLEALNGWSENTSCQGPEHVHIDLLKSVAHLTKTRMFSSAFCVITLDVALSSKMNRCRKTCLMPMMVMPGRWQSIMTRLSSDRNFSVICELGTLPYSKGHP